MPLPSTNYGFIKTIKPQKSVIINNNSMRKYEKDVLYQQRKNTQPDIDRTDVVFADDGVNAFIVKDDKNNQVVVVEKNISKGIKQNIHQVVANNIAQHINEYYTLIESGQNIYWHGFTWRLYTI